MAGIVHILKRWPCGGGMEGVARMHATRGESIYAFSGDKKSLNSDKAESNIPFAALHIGDAAPDRTVATVAEAARETWKRQAWTAGVFYNGYGLGWSVAANPQARRVFYLHSDYSGFEAWVRRLAPHADGILCCNTALRAKFLRAVPGFPDERVFAVPLAVNHPGPPPLDRLPDGGPVVIGYSGRVQIAQKRLDRLGSFLAALESAGVDYRFEVLGEGDALPDLQRQFGRNPRVVFHGHHSGGEYRDILSQWKYIFFCSDYEGLPVSLLEGVAAGAVPVYPDFHGGTDWPARLDPSLLYPIGDMEAAAEVVRRVENKWGAAPWALFRKRARALLEEHTPAGYFAAFDAAMQKVASLPPRSRLRASFWHRFTPLWLAHRFEACRRRTQLKGACRGTRVSASG